MKPVTAIFLALTLCSITTARPQFPDLSKIIPGIPDVSKVAPDVSKYISAVPSLFSNLMQGVSSAGPNNYGKPSTSIETGVQSAVNKGSTNSNNKNSAYNVAAKSQVENAEYAQAYEHQPPYHAPPPPPPKYE